MTEKLKLHTPDLTQQNIEKIAALFPHCVTEGHCDFELLKQELSNSIIDGSQERYQLNWVGKREALLTANAPIAKTLRPCREESVNFDTTENLYIEGDNLEAQALRRIYIPKKNGKLRPLGIPTMRDRAMQALYLLALEPVAEIQADKNSYGFRPKRSASDAIGQCFLSLSRKTSAQWIFEGDIKACFDEISHRWLMENVLMDKTILQQWLTAGYMENGVFYDTEAGTPQGGIISPALANLALDGLEEAVKQATDKTDKINIIRYADDFVITGNSKEILEQKVKPVVMAFLIKRGLTLSETKTHITHINRGFDFLGFNLRKYESMQKWGRLFLSSHF